MRTTAKVKPMAKSPKWVDTFLANMRHKNELAELRGCRKRSPERRLLGTVSIRLTYQIPGVQSVGDNPLSDYGDSADDYDIDKP